MSMIQAVFCIQDEDALRQEAVTKAPGPTAKSILMSVVKIYDVWMVQDA